MYFNLLQTVDHVRICRIAFRQVVVVVGNADVWRSDDSLSYTAFPQCISETRKQVCTALYHSMHLIIRLHDQTPKCSCISEVPG